MNLSLIAALCLAPPVAQPRAEVPEPVQSLLDRRASLPPEIAANVTIQLIRSGKIPAKEQRIELLEEAWQQGGRAKWPYPVVPAVTAYSTDTTLVMRLYASALHLDALWLRSTAVLALAGEDRNRALELFVAMGPPAPPKLTCADPHNFDVTIYYRTGLALARKLFTPADVRNAKRLDFLLDLIRGVSTPAQAVAALELLGAPDLEAAERGPLLNAWAGQLRTMQTDMRSFFASRDVAKRLVDLLPVLQANEIPARPAVEAFQEFFAHHWAGAPCAGMKGSGPDSWPALLVFPFEGKLAAAAGLPPLDEKRLRPSGAGEAPVNFRFWSGSQAQSILLRSKELRFGAEEQQAEYNKQPRRKDGRAHWLPEEMRRTAEWEDSMRRYLFELEDWKPEDGEPEIAWFHQRALNYSALLEIVPEGPMLKLVQESFAAFLRDAAAKWDSPGEWLYHVTRMLEPRGDSPERISPSMRRIVRQSGDAALNFLLDAHAILHLNSK
jgi:hypothetical protein